MAEAKVKCANCGLLTTRRRETGQMLEMDEHARTTGDLFNTLHGTEAPLCSVMAADLRKEYLDSPVTPEPWKRLLLIITLDRECSEFCDWMRGFTPKEHSEMIKAEAIRLAAERQQREMREWQAQQRREEREWQREQELDKRRHNLRVGVFMLLVSLVAGGIGSWVRDQWIAPTKEQANPENSPRIPLAK